MKFDLKKILPDVMCVVLFAAIAFAYFMPATLDGRRLEQHDSGANDGIGVEINQYRDANGGETPRWVTSLFGGMPTYQIAPSYNSTKTLTFIGDALHLWFPDYVWFIFASMLGFYILLRAFDFRHWMAALGAIVWAFSSYFFIIIAAGHIWKAMTLAYIPPTIAGMVMCYRAKTWAQIAKGTAVLALFASLQILSNHVQMTYYFLTVDLAVFVAFLITAVKEKTLAQFGKATIGVALAAVIAVALNISNLYHTYEYQNESMRGKSELVKPGANAANQTDSGLERDYITAWSYGIDETMTFLIPNAKGGATAPLSMSETAMMKADPQMQQMGVYNAFPQYWGEQPGTSGPVYLGALVCMLFIMSLMVIPNSHPLKWTLLAATILTLMLGWGRNFMPFTDFFIDNVPMYSKFRTVASILVVVEFTVPFLAIWGLKLWVEKPTLKPVLVAASIVILMAWGYDFMNDNCICSNDRNTIAQYVAQGLDQDLGNRILISISKMRSAMIAADVARSVAIICLGILCMGWYCRAAKKYDGDLAPAQATVLSIALLAICLVDMWMVNKRYLHDDMFVTPRGAARIEKTPADEYILAKSGTGRDYRVLNFTVSTFNDNNTSAFYSSIGGYHAAKLRRYQELIETHIAPQMSKVYEGLRMAELDTVAMLHNGDLSRPIYNYEGVNVDSLYPVINMLNTRWFILGGGQDGKNKIPLENPAAFGNAWFATNIEWAENANQEIDALGKVNLRNTAVVAKNAFGFLKAGGEGTVKLTSYTANEAKYAIDSKQGGLVVFSEVYYPGWTATIDGQETEVGRANYVLRAINVPAGSHEVVFKFDPQTVHTTETIAYVAFALLVLLFVGAIALKSKKSKAEE